MNALCLSLKYSEGPKPMTTLLLVTCAAGNSGLAPPGAYVCNKNTGKDGKFSVFL
jgi:hypothetical protein